MSRLSRGAQKVLDAALNRADLAAGDVPDPAHEAVEGALYGDETTVALAEAVAGLDDAEDLLADEVRAAQDDEAPEDLRALDSDALGVLDDAVDLLDRRVALVAREAVREERHGQTVDLRHAVMRDCPVCAAEDAPLSGRSWFAHLGSATSSTGEDLVDGWLCLGCGSVVHERTGEGGRVEEARVVDVDPRGSDLSAADLDVSEAWGDSGEEVDRGEGVETDGGVPVETCAATGCDRQATGQLFAEFDGVEFEVPTCDAHPPEVRTDGGRRVCYHPDCTSAAVGVFEGTVPPAGTVRRAACEDHAPDATPVEDLRTDGGYREPGRDEDVAGVERDAVECVASGTPHDGEVVATPEGPLCEAHAEALTADVDDAEDDAVEVEVEVEVRSGPVRVDGEDVQGGDSVVVSTPVDVVTDLTAFTVDVADDSDDVEEDSA